MKFKFIIISILCSLSLFSQEIKQDSVYIASFYHDKYHGRLAANGKIFSQDSLTCAHRTLPFGTIVEVTNTTNNKSIILEVTDRGPFIKGREIDLSRRAAEELNFIDKGLEKVTIKILK